MKLSYMKKQYSLKVRVNGEVMEILFYANAHSEAREEAFQIITHDLGLPETSEYYLELV